MGRYLELPFVLAVGLAALLSSGCSLPGGSTNWSAGSLSMKVDRAGRIVALIDRRTGRDYLADTIDSPLLSVQVDDVLHPPRSFAWDPAEGVAEFPDRRAC